MIAISLTSALAITGCGSSKKFPNNARPPTPVDLTIYINNSRVSVSPASVGAGPVIFIVSNQANHAQSVTIMPAGVAASQALANTGPINPQATSQVTVNFSTPGDYTVTTAANGTTDASLAAPTNIQAATLHVGPARAASNNTLLQP
ncbi:MAG: hypothetical protein M3018_05650 [Actinomycetota bacterium]|nr:hypothetical protein [Actinomycetota bacterium]